MKVIRFPQSCLLLEKDNHKLVIDPGNDFLATHSAAELQGVEAVLYTHQHSDHYEPSIAQALLSQGAAAYANAATAQLINNGSVTVVQDGDSFEAAGFSIVAHELPHCLLPNGQPGPQNTGYVIDGTLFHPGDGKELAGLQIDNLALPITGPDISMLDAFAFARQVGAKVAIPIHYDVFGSKPAVAQAMAETFQMPFKIIVLADGESTEL